MSELIKTEFSISDLENIIEIKAHTIRIWEKRYNLLNPERDKNGVRIYSLKTFLKMLNVKFLLNRGYKISKVASLSEDDLFSTVREQVNKSVDSEYFQSRLYMAMMSFDASLFEEIYREMTKHYLFKEIVYYVFFSFLKSVGMLWHTDTIQPAHEHFITQLIRQKILINTEKIDNSVQSIKDTTFVLFLPIGELHDVKLLMLNYELRIKGYNVIYLGDNIDLNSVKTIFSGFKNVHFVTILTLGKSKAYLDSFIQQSNEILEQYAPSHKLSIITNWSTEEIEDTNNIIIFNDFETFLKSSLDIDKNIKKIYKHKI